MASERIQRRIDRLMDQIEEAMDQLNWESVRDCSQAVLALDEENRDAAAFLASAERALGASTRFQSSQITPAFQPTAPPAEPVPTPIQTPTPAPTPVQLTPVPPAIQSTPPPPLVPSTPAPPAIPSMPATPAAPATSFADGRYQVKQLLGEGGKKKVYLAHDTLLDREVAFALIKAEGMDEASRQRITRV